MSSVVFYLHPDPTSSVIDSSEEHRNSGKDISVQLGYLTSPWRGSGTTSQSCRPKSHGVVTLYYLPTNYPDKYPTNGVPIFNDTKYLKIFSVVSHLFCLLLLPWFTFTWSNSSDVLTDVVPPYTRTDYGVPD